MTMPEPTSTTASVVTLTTMAAATPVLHVAGVSLGLRPDVLLAGFAGAVAAMALLNSEPSSGDTWRELLRTSLRRVGVAVASSATAGYLAPLLGLIDGVPAALLLSLAFATGAAAQKVLAAYVDRLERNARGGSPPGGPPGGQPNSANAGGAGNGGAA
jgi:NaMN:DMB phosphoribosyltransferase